MPSNVENILGAILTGDGSGIQKPASRVEELLFEIYEQGGGGGGDSVIGGIKLTIDSNYVMTATLVDKDGEEYGVSDDIDLPLEEMVVDAEYDPLTQKIKLELKNGNYVEFSVAELVSGLQTELSSSNKLNPAYIDYDASHRAVSDTEKGTWNAKQNAISDLETIRSGAAAGATAVQPSALETALSTKQDTISDLAAIRSGASAGATAVQPATMETALAGKQDSLDQTQLAAVNSGITSEGVAQIETNKDDISLVKDATEELIDKGAKNLFNPVNVVDLFNMTAGDDGYTYQSSDTDTRTYFAFSVDAYYNSTSISNVGQSAVYQNGIVAITFTKLPTFNRLKIGHSGVNKTIAIFVNVPHLENNKRYTVALNVTSYNPSVSLAWNHTMICTPEEWAVSQGFSEYTLPNHELTKLESEDRAALVEAIDNGVKNLLPKLKSYTDSGLSMVINDDNSITAKWSATGDSTSYARINDDNWTLPRGTYVLSGMPNTNNIGCYIHIETNTSQLVVNQERKTPVEFTIASDYEYLKIYISVRPNSAAETSGVTILPMIVTKAVSDIGANSYVPPAIQNMDLIVRESEDRAALAEVIDKGAKNIFNIFTAAEVIAETITRTINADGTVTVSNSGTNIYTATLTYRISLVANTQYVIGGCPSGGSDNTYSLSIRTTSAQPISDAIDYGSGSGVFTVPTSGEYVVYLRVAANYAFSDKIFKPMVCTKAAWDVSNKFVPYRPSYDAVVADVAKAQYTVQTADFACSAADTYEYTGLSVTVPAGHIYEILAYDNYNNNVPVAIAIATTNSNVDITTTTTMMAESSGNTSENTYFSCRSVMCITNLKASNETYYLFVKRNGTGSNKLALMWRQIV